MANNYSYTKQVYLDWLRSVTVIIDCTMARFCLDHPVDGVGCERWKSCCRAANSCCRRQLRLRTRASIHLMEGQWISDDEEEEEVERCASTWDGFSCWDSAEAGTTVRQTCPAYMERVITTRQYNYSAAKPSQIYTHCTLNVYNVLSSFLTIIKLSVS